MFKINELTYEYFELEFRKDNSSYFKGFNILHPLTNEKGLDFKIRKEVEYHNSVYRLNMRILDIAYIYLGVDFYFPTFMDFRGRIYLLWLPYPSGLNYQASDLSRALL